MNIIPANSNEVEYIGRWADITRGVTPTKLGICGGCKISFGFTGTSLTMLMDLGEPYIGDVCSVDTLSGQQTYTPSSCASQGGTWLTQEIPFYREPPMLEFSVDGGAWTRVAVDATTISLASLLQDTLHTVEIFIAGVFFKGRWYHHSGVMISGYEVDTGSNVSAWKKASSGKMLVIGDSVSEGQVLLGTVGINIPPNASGRLAFPNVLADRMGLDCWNFSFGGASITGTLEGYVCPPLDIAYDYIAEGIPKNDPQFDIVVIEAGSNDGSIDLTANYTNLVTKLKLDQPNATIFCMGRLYPSGGDNAYISAVAAATGTHYVSTAGWQFSAPYLAHPDQLGSAQIANSLYYAIRDVVPETPADIAPTSTIIMVIEGVSPPIANVTTAPTLRLISAFNGPLRTRSGRKTITFGIKGTGPIRMMTSVGVVVLA